MDGTAQPPPAQPHPDWPPGPGEMARLVREHDWAATPLGPREGWPDRFAGAVERMLETPMVASLACGPERVLLYNDAAAALYDDRHPRALGRPIPDTWPEAYAAVAPLYDRAFAGEALRVAAEQVDVSRAGGEAFDLALMPVRDAGGAVSAVLMVGFEVGARLRAESELREAQDRQAFLLSLSDRLRDVADPVAAMTVTAEMFGRRLGLAVAHFLLFDDDEDGYALGGAYSDGRLEAGLRPRGRLSDHGPGWGPQLRAGEAIFSDDHAARGPADAAASDAFGVRSGSAIPLIREGRMVALFSTAHPEPRRWTEAEKRLQKEVAERTWAAVERARAEKALRASEEKYRTLFETMGQGYCEHEVVRDGAGRAVDLRLIEANPRWSELTGLPGDRMLGGLIGDLVPFVEPSWIETYDRVVRSGRPERFENEAAALGRWFEVYAYPRGGDRFALLHDDITERKRAEAVLRASGERQSFLLDLSDALRPLADPLGIQAAALRVAGERLGIDRLLYAEMDEDGAHFTITGSHRRGGAAAMEGRWATAAFGPLARLRAGETVVGADLDAAGLAAEERAAFEVAGIVAHVAVPLVKEGRWLAALAAHMEAPRAWTANEVALLQDTAERTWAAIERARAEAALRASEEQLQGFGEASSDVLWIRDAATLDWTYLSPAFETIYGLGRDEVLKGDSFRNWLDLVVPEDRERCRAMIMRAVAGERVTFEYSVVRPADGARRILRNTDFPIRDAAGRVARIGGVGHDATEEREVAAALAASEERLRVLLEGIPQLVWRSCDKGLWTWSSPQWRDFTGQTQEQSIGQGWLDAVHPDDHAATLAAWDAARPTGKLDVEYRVRRAADGAWVWHHTRSVPVHDGAGRIVEWLGTSTDIQNLKDLSDRQHVLVAELQHRTRNIVAVIRVLADRTLRSSDGLLDFRDRFVARLGALARANGHLSRLDENGRVPFDELLRAELAAHGAGEDDPRVTLDGPAGVRLRSTGVQTLALALHELATNALKHGALGRPGGRLRVAWALDRAPDGPRLHIEWTESGVPIDPDAGGAARRGSGRELIERALPYQLDAATTYDLGVDGLRCTINLRVSSLESSDGGAEAG